MNKFKNADNERLSALTSVFEHIFRAVFIDSAQRSALSLALCPLGALNCVCVRCTGQANKAVRVKEKGETLYLSFLPSVFDSRGLSNKAKPWRS